MSKNRIKRKRLGDQKKQEVKDVKRLWETLKKVKEDIKKKQEKETKKKYGERNAKREQEMT